MSLVVDVLLGIYLGLLAGIVPALIAGFLGFLFKYITGVSIPAFAVIVMAAATAGVNGGLMGLLDDQVTRSPAFIVAILVVLMLAIYAHSQGDKLGAELPKRFSLRKLRAQTLSADVIQFVGGIGEVTIQPTAVMDLEGYPSLSEELREELHGRTWTFPADLPLRELETRLEDRLKTEYQLADVTVAIDDQGQARINAAPPLSGLSRIVPAGHRAVSLSTVLPTGLARGDKVTIRTEKLTTEGTVVSAHTNGSSDTAGDGDDRARRPTTTGGEGRITLSVAKTDAEQLLHAERGQIVVNSRGSRREFELLSLLRQAGKRFEKVTIKRGSSLTASPTSSPKLREEYGIGILAIRRGERDSAGLTRWEFSPQGLLNLTAGDEMFVIGTRQTLDQFRTQLQAGDQ